MSIEAKLPDGVTPALFRQHRAAVRGEENPQSMNNPVWEWLLRSRLSAYAANQLFDEPSSIDLGPGWCFDRFGQSRTTLPDGRIIFVAGEHEDYYDPDFFIYNDVVEVSPDGKRRIFGYSPSAFPPTDFHTATPLDGALLLIGSLGYQDERRAGHTQALRLDLTTFRMSRIDTAGDNPGWIHDHTAALTNDGRSIVVRGGKIDPCDGTSLVENIDDWQLDVETWQWRRLSHRAWPRFEVYREDRRPNHVWRLRHLAWSQQTGWHDAKDETDNLTEELGTTPSTDLIAALYSPGIEHEALGQDDNEHNVFRIRIAGVVVRYVEDSFGIQVTVEGHLPAGTVATLKTDLTEKLSDLENAAVVSRDIANI